MSSKLGNSGLSAIVTSLFTVLVTSQPAAADWTVSTALEVRIWHDLNAASVRYSYPAGCEINPETSDLGGLYTVDCLDAKGDGGEWKCSMFLSSFGESTTARTGVSQCSTTGQFCEEIDVGAGTPDCKTDVLCSSEIRALATVCENSAEQSISRQPKFRCTVTIGYVQWPDVRTSGEWSVICRLIVGVYNA